MSSPNFLHFIWETDYSEFDNEQKFELYKSWLKAHDWGWKFSEDPDVRANGQEEEIRLLKLYEACAIIDSDRASSMFTTSNPYARITWFNKDVTGDA